MKLTLLKSRILILEQKVSDGSNAFQCLKCLCVNNHDLGLGFVVL